MPTRAIQPSLRFPTFWQGCNFGLQVAFRRHTSDPDRPTPLSRLASIDTILHVLADPSSSAQAPRPHLPRTRRAGHASDGHARPPALRRDMLTTPLRTADARCRAVDGSGSTRGRWRALQQQDCAAARTQVASRAAAAVGRGGSSALTVISRVIAASRPPLARPCALLHGDPSLLYALAVVTLPARCS